MAEERPGETVPCICAEWLARIVLCVYQKSFSERMGVRGRLEKGLMVPLEEGGG